jgi:septum formation protein
VILLASASPRRADILRHHGIEFISESADIDETPFRGEPAHDYVVRLAKEKAENRLAGLTANGCELVIAADTCVAIEGKILGKPSDFEEFSSTMRMLSGKTHEVHSGVAVINAEKPVETVLVTTSVSFRPISEQEILSYWQSGEPADKAGGYGIQGLAAEFVQHLDGSYSNVVGLPIFETMQLLGSWGVVGDLNKNPM